uniref:5'-nucleotidase n=1 Tax=Meloidogyne javanica TaxID=6303 RepID=A0A915MG38_MELJA
MVQCSGSKMNASKLVNSLLGLSHVRIQNVEAVTKKLQLMAQASSNRLMTISDFDYTLSRYHNNGQKCVTTHGLLEYVAAEINPDFQRRICELRDKYVVIEYCPQTLMEDKIPIMEQWWRESHGLIEQYRPKKSKLRDAVKRSQSLLLRHVFNNIIKVFFVYDLTEKIFTISADGCADFLLTLHQAKVPVVLFSAGIGQIIEFVLEHQCDERQMDEAFLISQEAPFFKSIAERTSVLLLGDSLGDVHMDVGVCQELILNFNFDSLMERYMEEYDIVLVDDQTMEVPSKIFCYIHNEGEQVDNGIIDGFSVDIEKTIEKVKLGRKPSTDQPWNTTLNRDHLPAESLKMKPKQLVNLLHKLDSFRDPKLDLEQYATPPDIAVSLIQHINYDVENLNNCFVADLGCGTGIFVVGIDIDQDSLEICRSNIATFTSSEMCYDLIQMNLRIGQIPEKLHGIFDLVITNPPFGTKKGTEGADVDFVNAALLLAKPRGGRVYSLHKSSTRKFLEKRFCRAEKEDGEFLRVECVAEMRWNLDQSYRFHRKQSVDIAVDLFMFERNRVDHG